MKNHYDFDLVQKYYAKELTDMKERLPLLQATDQRIPA